MYRLIIADDEQIVCRALEHKIRNYVDEVELLPSVHDGVELLKSVEKYHPDIAIVDINMPELGGLEAIELLRIKKNGIRIVINTAYSEFEYAKKALKLGASDYLLKPSTKEVIIETIGKICRELDQKRQAEQKTKENQAAAEIVQELAESKWMQSLLLGQMDETCYQRMTECYRDLLKGGVFTAWKLASCEESQKVIKTEVLEKQILNYMRDLCHCVSISHKGIIYLFLMNGKEEESWEEWVLETIKFTRKNLEKDGIFTVVGIGRLKRKKEDFVSGLYEAKAVLHGRDRSGVVFAKRERIKEEDTFFGQAEKAAGLLLNGNREECLQEMKQKVRQLGNIHGESLERNKIRALAYLFELDQKICLLKGIEKETERIWDVWTGFRNVEDSVRLEEWMEREICGLDQYHFAVKKTENSYIQKAVSCMMKSYMRDLSLEEVAEEVGISSFYLSRLFKQEEDITFIELLTYLRMKKAVEMIKEGEKSVREISQSVGYVNMTYFYKVFKKTTGFTVGDMRRYF